MKIWTSTLIGFLIITGFTISGCFEPEEPLPAALTGLEISIDTSQGKTGHGVGDTKLTADGRILVTGIGTSAKTCTITLTESDHNTLLILAALVDWNGLKSKYIHPNNPNGCCDQLGYQFEGKLTLADSSKPIFKTFWFDEAMQGGTFGLPNTFRVLIQKLFDMRYVYSQKGLCLSAVTLNLDKTEYKHGETLHPTWSNQTSASIYLPGCTTYEIEKYDVANGKWVNIGPGAICGWEGYAQPVAPGKSHLAMTLAAPQRKTPPDVNGVGTYRLVGDYWTGCKTEPPQPISSAECSGGPFKVYSTTFTVSP